MPKIPDFSKFDLQSIVNSVKSIINPEGVTPKVSEGDPIGVKIVQISTLLQSVSRAQSQSAKDLTQINNLLSDLYKDLESFRKLEAELRQKQQASESSTSQSTTKSSANYQTSPTSRTGESAPTTGAERPSKPSTNDTPSIDEIDVKTEEEKLKKEDLSPLRPTEGTSKPSDKD